MENHWINQDRDYYVKTEIVRIAKPPMVLIGWKNVTYEEFELAKANGLPVQEGRSGFNPYGF